MPPVPPVPLVSVSVVIASFSLVKPAFVFVPNEATDVTITAPTRAAKRPYSIAVAPLSSLLNVRENALIAVREMFMVVARFCLGGSEVIRMRTKLIDKALYRNPSKVVRYQLHPEDLGISYQSMMGVCPIVVGYRCNCGGSAAIKN